MAANKYTNNDVVVTIEDETMVARISSNSKRDSEFVVKPCDKWGHFSISSTKGAIPKQLEGTYTSMPEAIDRIKVFLASAKPTPKADLETKYQARQKQKENFGKLRKKNEPVDQSESS